ncbi:hypothetical protein D9V37_17200 [Nocardioides mangrovicus]|uniref:Secreted protein n=1 Tax=Nocardioides mangrovicus TaxID=2478913 RepID=A0A3L8NY47_9ACTN|nr:hypothetical protein [Nocardioides mangrovicus]RLV47854.1 hypothetical protein D9V37_17200 [Nocardioides mangrovicus]
MTQAHRVAALVAIPVLAAAVAGCGGGDSTSSGSASATPSTTSSSTSPSPSPSASASASPSPTQAPLSRFEDLGPVKGVRAWNVAYAQDVNAQQFDFPRAKKLSTSALSYQSIANSDIKDKQLYPGPTPFTPVRIERSGSIVKVIGCARLGGWTLVRATNKPHDPPKVAGIAFNMTKTGGVWKVADVTDDDVTCSGVKVVGVPFAPS